jgi:integrase
MSRRTRRAHDGGSVDRLPSGRWRVRYFSEAGRRHTRTFKTRKEAGDFLASVRTDQMRGEWRDPRSGARPVADYARAYLDTRTDLRPSTRRLYGELLARWIDTDLTFAPPGGSGRPRVINIGARHLRALTVADVREWHAAVTQTAIASVESIDQRRLTARVDDSAAAREWARANGMPVSPTGRLPRAAWDAWTAAGRPPRRSRSLPPRDAPNAVTQPRHAYALLRLVLNAALRDGLIQANPCQLPGAGSPRRTSRRIPTPAQVEALAAHMPQRLSASVVLAAYSGLRGGELFALARCHVDLNAGALRVERTLMRPTAGAVAFGPPKTDAGRRLVHLPDSVAELLAAHMAEHVPDDPDALLFATLAGKPLPSSRRTEAFTRARLAAGLDVPGLTWHSLRHFHATQYARTGATTKDLQARLGHATVVAAMVYQHTDADRDRSLTDFLDHLRDPAPNVTPIHRAR